MADVNKENACKTAQQSTTYATDALYQSFGIHVDVVDEGSVQLMVETAVKGLGGRIDYFVNCAGVRSASAVPLGHTNVQLDCKYIEFSYIGPRHGALRSRSTHQSIRHNQLHESRLQGDAIPSATRSSPLNTTHKSPSRETPWSRLHCQPRLGQLHPGQSWKHVLRHS